MSNNCSSASSAKEMANVDFGYRKTSRTEGSLKVHYFLVRWYRNNESLVFILASKEAVFRSWIGRPKLQLQ